MACRLSVMMNDLQEIMLGVLEDHEDAFVFENDFDETNHVHVTQLGTEGHFPDCRLGDSCVLDLLAFLVCDF